MAGIYVHIPFCKQRCAYCDFYSTVQKSLISNYIDAVISEARLRSIDNVKTLYVGGGTPSQLSPVQLSRLIDGLREVYDLNTLEEFTIEVNPDDVTFDYAKALIAIGVNRVSMGVQSFIDAELHIINRRHDAKGAKDAVDTLRAAGINNISIDLIYGLPGQTIETWRQSIEMATLLLPQHISAYNLSYEYGTKLWLMRERGEVIETDDATCVDMYNMLTTMLHDAGYEHYEISNFSLPGFYSRHNSSYWNYTPYLGLGASAHSFDGINRSYNPASINEYIQSLLDGRLPCVVEKTEWWEQYDEMIMVGLRTSRGLRLDDVSKRFGEKILNYLLSKTNQFVRRGELVCEGDCIYIPEQHFMMSDGIIRELMWEE